MAWKGAETQKVLAGKEQGRRWGLAPLGGRRVGLARGSQPGLSGALFLPLFPTMAEQGLRAPAERGLQPGGPHAPLTCLLRGLGRGWGGELGD